VVAEGVETEAQLLYLQEKGCQFVQGHHLGRPTPQAIIAQAAGPPSVIKPSLVVNQRG
jgi:EAL domain-containing protein (putative c-di-GMP-specific phosphodiesterase class I)